MIKIDLEYTFKKYHTFSSSTSAMMFYGIKNQIKDELKTLLANCTSIDEVIDTCIKKYTRKIASTLVIYITINKDNYILNHKFQLITMDDINRLKFIPHVKYDIDNIRVTTLEPLERKLYSCTNKEEQISVIKKYIEKPYRRFKKWEVKPSKIFLYHSYHEKPLEFKIIYDQE